MDDFGTFSKLLKYNKNTGQFTWKKRGYPSFDSRYAGKKAGTVHESSTGRKSIKIKVNGKNYFAHRVAFLLVNGEWPEGVVDHEDQDSLNNKWKNLRDVSQKQNMRNRKMPSNNKSGYPNVHKRGKRWVAKVMPAGVLGSFECPIEASNAAVEYKLMMGYGENHGRT